ncbi:MAG: NAD(P)H-quinone oxidoreductase [Planctomycetes bacterium]|nr:NAD(P)H-quinone oxidoreductase [Planctomycetota bacterium]
MLADDAGNLSWSAVPDPQPRRDEVLVTVHAAAVNRADLLQRVGKYPPPPGAPAWMGLEAAGIVAGVGPDAAPGPGGRPWQVGDRVCALLPGGGYAEAVAARPELLLPVPAALSMAEAASLPEVFATAYLDLVLEAGLQAGDTVLIQAGASGVGVAAIQLAKLLGAHVLTTVSGPAKAAAVRRLGADEVVDRRSGDLGAAMDACAAAGRPVAIALDCVGGTDLGPHLARMADGGRWVLIATLGGETAEIPLRVVLKRGLRLIGSTLRSRPLAMKACVIAGVHQTVWPALAAGTVRPVVHAVLPMAEAAAAHAILERGENIGKVALTVLPD